MIKIQCSVLEQARANPVLFGKNLAANNTIGKGGTHGMLAYWQDASLKVHQGDVDVRTGIKDLERNFMNFSEIFQAL